MLYTRIRTTIAIAAAACLACLVSVPASAQSFGIGPRLSFVRGDLPTATPSSSFVGGTIRLVGSKHHAFEVSLETRTTYNELRTSKKQEIPIQASLLLFPVRAAVAPYLLGGFGIYRATLSNVDANGAVLSSTQTQETGFHLGGGLEILLTKHVGIYGDYRFRFVRFGAAAAGEQPINIPLVDSVNLSHRGSMWTSGMAFYF